MDCATLQLWQALQQQTLIGHVNLEGIIDHHEIQVHQRIELRDVRIESIETSERQAEYVPLERIRLVYGTVRVTSFCIDAQGEDCGSTEYEFDFNSGGP